MSYAIQVHHTFDRLKRCFNQDGFTEIDDAATIEYPSFRIVNVQNDSFEQSKRVPALTFIVTLTYFGTLDALKM